VTREPRARERVASKCARASVERAIGVSDARIDRE